jgi:hypothetical protein
VCEHPKKLRYGVRMFDEVFDGIIRNGTVVEFSCEKGWTLNGPVKKMCLVSGLWDPEERPQCMKNDSVQLYYNLYVIFLLILGNTNK